MKEITQDQLCINNDAHAVDIVVAVAHVVDIVVAAAIVAFVCCCFYF